MTVAVASAKHMATTGTALRVLKNLQTLHQQTAATMGMAAAQAESVKLTATTGTVPKAFLSQQILHLLATETVQTAAVASARPMGTIGIVLMVSKSLPRLLQLAGSLEAIPVESAKLMVITGTVLKGLKSRPHRRLPTIVLTKEQVVSVKLTVTTGTALMVSRSHRPRRLPMASQAVTLAASVQPTVTIGIALKVLRSPPQPLPQMMKPAKLVENAKHMAITGIVPKALKSHLHRHRLKRAQKTSAVSVRPMEITGTVLKVFLNLLPLRRRVLQQTKTSQQL